MLSPDGKTLAYVSTQGGARTTNIWVMDLATRRTRNLTGDGSTEIRAHHERQFPPVVVAGRPVDRLHLRSRREVDRCGTGGGRRSLPSDQPVRHARGRQRAAASDHDHARPPPPASPQWSADGSKLLVYELPTRDTFGARMGGFGIAQLSATSQIVEIDVATGARTVITQGPGLKTNPHYLPGGRGRPTC